MTDRPEFHKFRFMLSKFRNFASRYSHPHSENRANNNGIVNKYGGEEGIRTLDTVPGIRP